jgi:hypothetical protein
MGWWKAGPTNLVWGDTVADLFDRAIDQVVTEFQDARERNPTAEELLSGFKFALAGYEQETEG